MKPLQSLAILTVILPVAAGCTSRTAPFDQMDKAQITVLRLQPQQQAAPTPQQGMPGLPGLPGMPGLPAEWGQMVQQGAQAIGGMIPGLGGALPGGIPGAQPQQPALPQFKGFGIIGQQPLTDDGIRDEILDIFGSEGSFSANRGNCFLPGMGVVMTRPGQPNVDLLISFSCNQAMGDGFRWPYQVNGFTQETHDRLAKVYEKIFNGPVPPGS
jgi:hypothetical protein